MIYCTGMILTQYSWLILTIILHLAEFFTQYTWPVMTYYTWQILIDQNCTTPYTILTDLGISYLAGPTVLYLTYIDVSYLADFDTLRLTPADLDSLYLAGSWYTIRGWFWLSWNSSVHTDVHWHLRRFDQLYWQKSVTRPSDVRVSQFKKQCSMFRFSANVHLVTAFLWLKKQLEQYIY